MVQEGKEIGIVNFGSTRADDLELAFKYELDLSDLLPKVVDKLSSHSG